MSRRTRTNTMFLVIVLAQLFLIAVVAKPESYGSYERHVLCMKSDLPACDDSFTLERLR